jgi:hypothetical protein
LSFLLSSCRELAIQRYFDMRHWFDEAEADTKGRPAQRALTPARAAAIDRSVWPDMTEKSWPDRGILFDLYETLRPSDIDACPRLVFGLSPRTGRGSLSKAWSLSEAGSSVGSVVH